MAIPGGKYLLDTIAPADIYTPEDFTDEHKMIADTVVDFVNKDILPKLEEMEHQEEGVMRSILDKAGELGILGADITEEYDGSELGKIASAIICEYGAGGGSYGVSHGAHTGIGSLPIVLFGNEEQKKKYLPGLANGQLIAAFALTEPGAGSDALNAKTKAVLSDDGKHYILNGEKIFISNAGFADVFIVFAKLDEKFTAFIVEKGTPGFSLGAEEKKMGIKGSSTRSLIFEDAKIPVENLLFEIGKGHVIALNVLNIGRYKLGAGAVGASKIALATAVKYAQERQQFKTPIADFGMIQHKIAQMNIKSYAAESATYRLVGDIEEVLHDKTYGGEIGATIDDYAIECAISKVLCSEVLDYCVDECVQIHGGYGFVSEYPAERFYRDARINRIFEGTNEVCRLVIPSTLIRKAMKGKLPLMQAAQAMSNEIMNLRASVEEDGKPLAAERAMINIAKKLFLLIGGQAVQKYMQKLANEQEVIALMADMAIQIYAMESSVLRALKAYEKDPAAAEMKIDLASAYCYDVFPMFDKWAKEALCYMFDGDMLRTQLSIVKRMLKFPPINLVALRRKICAKVLEEQNYVV